MPVIDQNPAKLSSGFGAGPSRAFPHEFPQEYDNHRVVLVHLSFWMIASMIASCHVLPSSFGFFERFIILMHVFGPQPISWAHFS